MKAYRNMGGNVVEIEVDIGLDNEPILPPDTTVDPKPEPLEGHYVTVVDKAWVQIPIPVEFKTFDTIKAEKLAALAAIKQAFLDAPVEVNGVAFDADEIARSRLSQALTIHTATNYLPSFWLAADNSMITLTTINDLLAIVGAVQNAFAQRFADYATMRATINAASTQEELDLVVLPVVAGANEFMM